LSELVGVSFEAPPVVEATKIDFTPKRVETAVETKRDKKIEREPPVLEPELPGLRGDRRGDDFGLDNRSAAPGISPARVGGVEGWVRVQFSVTSIGTVRDAKVIDSEPGTIFDEAGLKAITRWRYNPRVENGEAVERVGLQTIIRFELEN
jgi:TonB family protein